MNIGQAKQIDLVEYLASLGYNPAKIKNEEYWYLSPLREERTASFKVDRGQNIWYDHGLGKGGTLIDFGTQYHDCSVRELLKRMHGNLSFHQPPVQPLAREESLVKIISERNLVSLSLLRYIKQRRVAEEVARKYCREIVFSLHQKTYSAIGLKIMKVVLNCVINGSKEVVRQRQLQVLKMAQKSYLFLKGSSTSFLIRLYSKINPFHLPIF